MGCQWRRDKSKTVETLPSKRVVSSPYPGAVVNHVASQRRRQVLGFLFEPPKLLSEAKALGIHDDVEQGNGSTCVICGLRPL